MQTTAPDGTALTTTPTLLKQAVELNTSLRVIAEWNQNRYATIVSVLNGTNPNQTLGPLFPISSIVESFRPQSKIAVAFTNITSTNTSYTGNVTVVANPENKYKYWIAPNAASTSLSGGSYAITQCTPTIIFSSMPWANKITFTVENTAGADLPNQFTVDTTIDGTNWTTIATNPTIDPTTGMCTLYRQANGTWSSTVNRVSPTGIQGVRLNVTGMASSGKYFKLIELAPKLESDLSAFTIDFDFTSSMSETDFVTPLGVSSGNQGRLNLSNIDQRFSNANTGTIYGGILDKNVLITIDVGTKTGFGGVESSYEWVRQVTALTDTWNEDNIDQVSVALQDHSQYLQATKAQSLYLENVKPGAAIVAVLTSIGFDRYSYNPAMDEMTIPYFWVNEEDTVWDVINKLSRPLQMACYFDEYGILQIEPSKAAYNVSAATSWTFSAVNSGANFADIISLEKQADYEANVVNVNYKTTSISKDKYGFPAMETVWEPEGTQAIRARRLATTLGTSDTYINILRADAAVWPYSGLVRINNEYIRFEGKGVTYVDLSSVTQQVVIKTNEELDNIKDNLTTYDDFVSFDGRLLITKRGEFNSVVATHNVGNLNARFTGTYGNFEWALETPRVWYGGMGINPYTGYLRLYTKPDWTWAAWYTMRNGTVAGAQQTFFSTSVRFPLVDSDVNGETQWDYTHGDAGIAMYLSDSNDSGYYLDLALTKGIEPVRAWQQELCLTYRATNGAITRYALNKVGTGEPFNVVQGKWYDLDVRVTPNNGAGGSYWEIYLNGILAFWVNTPTVPSSGKYGLFARGYTVADFGHLAAAPISTVALSPIAPDYVSVRYGEASSGVVQDSIVTDRFGNNAAGEPMFSEPYVAEVTRRTKIFYDEFAPVVYEVREYDTKFSKTPVVHSRLFNTNEEKAFLSKYIHTPFGAKFILQPAKRMDAILSGEDTSFSIDNPIQQKLLVYGRVVSQADSRSYTIKNDAAVRRRGEVSIDLESDWIQNEAMSTVIANFIIKHWAGGQDEITLEVFMNPLVQIGDVVAVDYTTMAISGFKYFVVGTQRAYSKEGPTTTLTLRRARI